MSSGDMENQVRFIPPQLIGNRAARDAFLGAAKGGRQSRSVLISGPEGSGRKSAAFHWAAQFSVHGSFDDANNDSDPAVDRAKRLMAQDAHPDILVLEGAGAKGQIPAERARALQKFQATTPSLGRGKAAIVTNANALNTESANAILKVLEEPKAFLSVILVAGHPQGLLPTIRSRCALVRFQALDQDALAQILEAHDATLTQPLRVLARGDAALALKLATHSDRLSVLDQVAGSLLAGPSVRIAPGQVAGLIALEKVLGQGDVERLLLETLRQRLAGGQALAHLGAELYPRFHDIMRQRDRLSLDSTASWADALAQLHAMVSRSTAV